MAFTKRGSAFSLVILIYLSLFSLGYSSEATYAWKKTSEDIRIWINQDSLDYDYSWIGKNVEGVAHGVGTLCISKDGHNLACTEQVAYYGSFSEDARRESDKGDIFIGPFDANGNLTDFGVEILPSNEIYIGEFSNHLANGHLTYLKKGIVAYRGNWVNNERSGIGEECDSTGFCKKFIWSKNKPISSKDSSSWKIASGRTFYGNVIYENNKPIPNGYGQLVSEQDTLEGFWKKGTITGPGTYKKKNILYEGDFVDGKISGLGFLWLDSVIYSGSFVDGALSGIADYYHQNGSFYSGEWENGLPHGYGKYATADYTYEGSWEEGWINGEGVLKYANGDIYEGDFVENKRYGQGRYKFNNGRVYEGEFVNDSINGLGIYHNPVDGFEYEGSFSNGKFYGDGSLYLFLDNDTIIVTANWPGNGKLPSKASILFSNGDLYEGELKNGEPTENGTWSSHIERKSQKKDILHKFNDFYKKHKDTWNKAVTMASVAITGVALATPIIYPPAASVVVPIAEYANIVLNVVDAAVAAGSASIDLIDSIQAGGDVVDPAITLGSEVAVNAALVAVPKFLKLAAVKSAKAKLSQFARKKAKSLLGGIGKASDAQVVKIEKNKDGAFFLKLQTSKVGRFLYRLTGRLSDQAVSSKTYDNYVKRYGKNNLELGEDASGTILRKNMKKCMSSKRMYVEKKMSNTLGRTRAEAHHIVAGTNPKAKRSREILEKCGIDINDPRNGILLPKGPESIFKGSIHGNHGQEYDDYVLQLLEQNIVRKKDYSEKATVKVLDHIKQELYEGKLMLLTNQKPKANTIFQNY